MRRAFRIGSRPLGSTLLAAGLLGAGMLACTELPTADRSRVRLTLSISAPDTMIVGDTAVLRAEARDPNGWLVQSPPVRWNMTGGPTTLDSVGDRIRVVARRWGLREIWAFIPPDDPTFAEAQEVSYVRVRYDTVLVRFLTGEDTALTALGQVTIPAEAVDGHGRKVEGGMFSAGLATAVQGWSVRTDHDTVRLVIGTPGTGRVILSHAACMSPCADTLLVKATQTPASVVVGSVRLVSLGESDRLVAVVRDANGHEIEHPLIHWRLLDPGDSTVIFLSEVGGVQARINGTAEVEASSGAVSDTATVTVSQTPASLEITGPTDPLVGKGATDTLRLLAYDALGHRLLDQELETTWWSGDPGIVAVAASYGSLAVIEARGYGITSVSAHLTLRTPVSGPDTVSFNVTVEPDADSIRVFATTDTLTAFGATTQLRADVYEDGQIVSGVRPHWQALDPETATVDADGRVTAVAEGTARFEGRIAAVADTIAITVERVPVELRIDPAPALVTGARYGLRAYAIYADGGSLPTADATWSSDDPGRVMVDGTGVVTGAAEGVTMVRARLDGLEDSVAVLALPPDYTLVEARRSACVLSPSGTVYCGLDHLAPVRAPDVRVFAEAGPNPDSLGSGGRWCSVDGRGIAFCWGMNYDGELGVGDATSRADPTPVLGNIQFSDISIGSEVSGYWNHACGLDTNGNAYCWGYDIGTSPHLVTGQVRFQQIETMWLTTCAVAIGGGAFCWRNPDVRGGQPPTPVQLGDSIVALSTGQDFACGLVPTGNAYCWGRGMSGQLGTGVIQDRDAASLVVGGHAFQRVSAGLNHACGLDRDGAVFCWGANGNGQLGDGTTTSSAVPVRAAGDTTFADVTAGAYFTLGRMADGTLWAWGATPGTVNGFYWPLVQGRP